MRQAQTLYATAFLIDQNGSAAADTGAHLIDQGPHLRGIVDVAGEQNEAERIVLGEETLLLIAEDQAGAAIDDR